MTQASSWKDRAVSTWRQNQLGARLRTLLDIDLDPSSVNTTVDGTFAVVDGIKFILRYPDGDLDIEAPCPSCGKPQKTAKVETIADVGRALDSPCRDCDFLVKSGLKPGGAARPAGRL